MRQINEIATVLESRNYSIHNSICEVLKKFKFRTLCHKTGIIKKAGFSTTEILTLLLMLPLMMLKNIHQLYKSEYAKREAMKKDTIYRLKNNEWFSWRRLLCAVAKTFQEHVKPSTDSPTNPSAFIIDDTTDQRVGRKIEKVSYVFDHVLQKTVLGFKILTLGYYDGKSLTPIDFTVHEETKLKGKKAKEQHKKEVDSKSPGAKRRAETRQSKIKAALDMVKRGVKNGFLPAYVLCDAWFTCEELITEIRGIKSGAMHLIAGIKNGNQKYGYEGALFNAKQIKAQLQTVGKQHRCRTLGLIYYEAVVTYKGAGTIKLFICRYPRQKHWRAFVTTDTSLSFLVMMKVYGIRWTIEVFFRECKQYLGLGKCQSKDFDAQIASITITFILYTLLCYLKRMESYETLGELFRLAQQDTCEKLLAERLWIVFEEMLALVIEAISTCGSMDVSELIKSEEFCLAKELFASSFLFEQLTSVNNIA